MTYEEAIKLLKEDKSLYETEICFAGDGTPEGDLIMALNMAIEALEKQIPKKPLKSDKTIRYCEVWECHSCGFEWSGRVVDYCYKCGQAIDWEGTE